MISWLKSLFRKAPYREVVIRFPEMAPIFVDTRDVDGERAAARALAEEEGFLGAQVFYKRDDVWLVDQFTDQGWVLAQPGDPGIEQETD